MEYYTIMKDKIAQRERTEGLVGGARTFNEFVKEKAVASNITPACVRSLPEIKEEWKQLKLQQLAEKKAERTATREAKKAEKKATQKATKASAKSDTAVAKEKTAIKKVAKKSAVDTENIKMVLVEKAHKKSQAEKPPQEPKVKGRPKKYATPEEARRAKIEATKALNKAKKASLPPKPPKAVKPQKQGKKPKEPEVTAEQIRRENEEEARLVRKRRKAYDREMRRRGEVEQMGMEDDDAGEKWHPLVHEIEMKIYQAKTGKEIDEVLKLIKQATQSKVYDTLDPVNIKSLDHSIDVYSKKKMAWFEHQREAQKNIAMFKTAKPPPPPSVAPILSLQMPVATAEEEAELLRPIVRRQKKQMRLREKTDKYSSQVRADLRQEIQEILLNRIKTAPRGTTIQMIEHLNIDKVASGEYEPSHKLYELAEWADNVAGHLLYTLKGLNEERDKKRRGNLEEGEIYEGKGFNPDDLKEFKNYVRTTDHLSHHLDDLKESLNPQDVRDYIHFTKEKARLKSKLVGGLVRMIGGDLECSDSDSDSDMEGGESKGFFGNIKRAFETSWNRPVQSNAERKVLDATLNYFEPAVLAPLNIIAPPVGKIGEAQRQLMKSKAGV